MNDFLLAYKNTITFGVEILSAVTGLLVYSKYKSTAAKFFIWFLVGISFCDYANTYVYHIKNDGFFNFLEGTVFVRNYWWTTLYWNLGAILFFCFFYYNILASDKLKSIVKFIGITYSIFFSVYIMLHWEDFFVVFFPAIEVAGALVVFICTIFYFIEVLQSDKILTFYKSLNFFISFAIFIWWLIITPLIFYDIYHSNKDWNFIFLKWQIFLFANITMYLTFTFALLWCKPEND